MGKRAEQSKAVYNEMAAQYDTLNEGVYTRPHKAMLLEKVSLRSGDAVLDVACGNGALLAGLAQKADVSAFGLDLSDNMIAAARERVPTGDFRVGPCVPLPFADASMDVVTVSCAFHHFEAPQEFARECHRVLKPGGAVYLAEPYFNTLIRGLANALVFPLSRSGDVKVYSAVELCAFFTAAGFAAPQTEVRGTVLFFSAQN